MTAHAVLFAGRRDQTAYTESFAGQSVLEHTVQAALKLPDCAAVRILCTKDFHLPAAISSNPALSVSEREEWTVSSVLEELAAAGEGVDYLYWAWADAPLLDVQITQEMRALHIDYAAEYTYADGYPYGFSPELLASGTVKALQMLSKGNNDAVERDMLFSIIQKDINSFDIETLIAPVDLRSHRLSFTSDTARNQLLLKRFHELDYSGAADAERFISEHPEALRTLPSYWNIQVCGGCPVACSFCPYPAMSKQLSGKDVLERRDYMPLEQFTLLLDKIQSFSDDAYISLSAWGEPFLHPQFEQLVAAVLERPELSLIIETVGLGASQAQLDTLIAMARNAVPRIHTNAAVSIIVSLDASCEETWKAVKGEGWQEAYNTVHYLQKNAPELVYIQALRLKDYVEDLEAFYKYWKQLGAKTIVQKYDWFCGVLEQKRVADLSPVRRHACWHILRDVFVLLDGSVLQCREDLEAKTKLGNVFTDDVADIWERGQQLYMQHVRGEYPGLCGACDEYYTFNF